MGGMNLLSEVITIQDIDLDSGMIYIRATIRTTASTLTLIELVLQKPKLHDERMVLMILSIPAK